MTQEDPDGVNVVLRVVQQRASQLLPPADASIILNNASRIQTICDSQHPTAEDWETARGLAERVATRVAHLRSLLTLPEARALQIGIVLGRIYHRVDDQPDRATQLALR